MQDLSGLPDAALGFCTAAKLYCAFATTSKLAQFSSKTFSNTEVLEAGRGHFWAEEGRTRGRGTGPGRGGISRVFLHHILPRPVSPTQGCSDFCHLNRWWRSELFHRASCGITWGNGRNIPSSWFPTSTWYSADHAAWLSVSVLVRIGLPMLLAIYINSTLTSKDVSHQNLRLFLLIAVFYGLFIGKHLQLQKAALHSSPQLWDLACT